jgi:hypothetical protein
MARRPTNALQGRLARPALTAALVVGAALVRPGPAAQSSDARWRGFGAATQGGLAGRLIRVTSLAADGEGTLRAALEAPGPRLVVFDVSGVIDLDGRELVVTQPDLTLAGQTAPDPGVTIIRGELTIETHDVVVQHIASRPGDRGLKAGAARWEPDAMGARRGRSGPVYNVVFDHCSATWSIDESLSVSGPADTTPADGVERTSHDVTLRRCLIAEGLSHATHSKGEHSKGTLIHDGVRDVSIVGCLYAHNGERNPRLKGGTRSVVAESLMYDWGNQCVGVGANGNRRMLEPAEAVLVSNLAIAGPSTQSLLFVKPVDPAGRVLLAQNLHLDARGKPLRALGEGILRLEQAPEWARYDAPIDPLLAAARVLRQAGSRAARRDPIDTRIVQSVLHGDGRIIDSQEEVGGYPTRATARRVLKIPEGAEARTALLERLSIELGEDARLELQPLWKRIGVTPARER